MIGVHLSISDLRCARNGSSCAFSEETVSAPAAASRLITSGSFSAFCRAADSVSITGFGVPLGAHMPNQTVIPTACRDRQRQMAHCDRSGAVRAVESRPDLANKAHRTPQASGAYPYPRLDAATLGSTGRRA